WRDGTNRWTAGAGGNNIGGGWNIYNTVFSGDDGVIYGITPDGLLQWYRHDGWRDGTNRWTAGAGGNNIGGGWNIYNTVFSGDDAGRLVLPVNAIRRIDRIGSPGRTVLIDAMIRKLGRIRLPQKSGGVIHYRRVVCDAAGVLRAYEGEVPVRANEPLPVGPLDFIGESFSYKHSFVDESGSLRVTAGEVTATAQGRVQVGTVKLGGSIDGKTLTAQGAAEFVTARIEGSASVDVPGAAAGGGGHLEGPAARGSVGIGLDGGGAVVGVSAGSIGGHVGVTIGGKSFGVGGEIGLKAELGLQWGPTSTIKLPLITISGPNPLAGVTSFAAGAVSDLVRDPFRTTEKAVTDILGVGEDAVEAAGQIVEGVFDAVDDLFGDDEPNNIFTTDQQQGPRPDLRNAPPGTVIID
ncbi:tachylectin-related carbohydrate-binding protein, partial [Streptomyces sp. NPDC007863]|uniref:tachylectin-related carbohydrate-binding protein n=1 Tax=Streptomyces sp. NPDC007863 TaxID=3154894 RepID=UPI0033D79603